MNLLWSGFFAMDYMTLAYILILVGLGLLIAEVFIPSGGILLVLSVVSMIVGVTFAFNEGPYVGMSALLILAVTVAIFGVLFVYFWPKTPMGRKFFLQAPSEDETLAHNPVNLELEQLRGRYGRTLSSLRPAGITEFDGRRIDTISEGTLIGPGQWVQCIDVQSGKVVVRQVEAPPDLENIDPSDLEGTL